MVQPLKLEFKHSVHHCAIHNSPFNVPSHPYITIQNTPERNPNPKPCGLSVRSSPPTSTSCAQKPWGAKPSRLPYVAIGVLWGLYWGFIGVIWGLYRGDIGVI